MNDIQSGITAGSAHPIAAPLEVAISRMPDRLRTARGVVDLQREPDQPTWAWTGPRSAGTVTLSALSPAATSMVIAAGDAAGEIADALAVELYGVLERQWAPPPVAARAAMGRVGKLGIAAAAVLIPLLAITGLRVLSPPKPMDVASAVTQFREQSTPPADAAAGTQQAAAKSSERETKPGRTTGPRATRSPRQDAAVTTTQSKTSAQPAGGGSSDQVAAQDQRRSSASTEQRDDPTREPSQRKATAQQQTAPASPEPGVYRYATDGYESIDRPSSRHDYPKETATTIQATDCGFRLRWQPLENRWDEMSMCNTEAGAFIAGMATHREFYGQENDTQYECSRGTYAYRPQPGATWTGTCSDGDAKMQLRGRTIGREAVQVGNETVEAVHFLVEGQLSGGDAQGTWKAQRWVDADTGLVLRLEAQTQATSKSSVGEVHYSEQLSLRLLSTTPER